jgi:hypothetical protein
LPWRHGGVAGSQERLDGGFICLNEGRDSLYRGSLLGLR